MLTKRDYQVIKAVGDHRLLSFNQIQELFFPSYHTCWRRMNKELKANKYLSEPFYIEVGQYGSRTGVYRLEKTGRKIYREMTGKKYKTPKFHLQYVPHLIETNWFLIYFGAKQFEIEHQVGSLKMDAYFDNIALEVDLSEYESRNEYIKEYEEYRKHYQSYSSPNYLVIFSDRADRIREWLGAGDKPEILYCRRSKQSVLKLKNHLLRRSISSFHSS